MSAFPLDARFGLDRGFEVYDDRMGGAGTTAFAMPERPGEDTVRAARRWIDSVRGQKWFAFVHLYEPHFPYEPPAALASSFPGEPYQGEVAAADAALGPLLEPLLAASARERTLVVFTSDHGESLGEHGEATHGVFAYEATLRVPLVLHAPGLPRATVVSTPVRHVDVLPTVIDLLGLPPLADRPGRSLLPLIAGSEDAAPESYLESLSPSLNRGWAPLRGIVSGGLKYVDLPLPEIYDLATDPREQENVVASRPRDLDRLRARLAGLRAGEAADGARVPEDESALERLRALGYVAVADPGKRLYTAEDDPKTLIALDARLEEVITLYRSGRALEAIAACEEILRRRPDMPQAYLQLAYLERGRGRLEAAIAASRRAVDLRPLDPETVSLHAVYLTEAGHPREAIRRLEPLAASARPDVDVLQAPGDGPGSSGRARRGPRHVCPGPGALPDERDGAGQRRDGLPDGGRRGQGPPGVRSGPRDRRPRRARPQRPRRDRGPRGPERGGHRAVAARGGPRPRGLPDALQPGRDPARRGTRGGSAAVPAGVPAPRSGGTRSPRRRAGARVARGGGGPLTGSPAL